jgi:hypothetical protein
VPLIELCTPIAADGSRAVAHVYLSRTPEQVEAVADAITDALAAELDPSRVIVATHAFRL